MGKLEDETYLEKAALASLSLKGDQLKDRLDRLEQQLEVNDALRKAVRKDIGVPHHPLVRPGQKPLNDSEESTLFNTIKSWLSID